MDRQTLEADLVGLKAQQEQLKANFGAISGAIQYIEQKLAELAAKVVPDAATDDVAK